ncbi:hypothetical protein ACSFCD_00885 [Enterococcus faecalis]
MHKKTLAKSVLFIGSNPPVIFLIGYEIKEKGCEKDGKYPQLIATDTARRLLTEKGELPLMFNSDVSELDQLCKS